MLILHATLKHSVAVKIQHQTIATMVKIICVLMVTLKRALQVAHILTTSMIASLVVQVKFVVQLQHQQYVLMDTLVKHKLLMYILSQDNQVSLFHQQT